MSMVLHNHMDMSLIRRTAYLSFRKRIHSNLAFQQANIKRLIQAATVIH